MESILSKDILVQSFKKLGLKNGDTVFISSNIAAIGKIQKLKKKYEYCEVYFQSLLEVLGKNGTIVVPSYTNNTARDGKNFILEDTESNMGVFSEHIRKKKKLLEVSIL